MIPVAVTLPRSAVLGLAVALLCSPVVLTAADPATSPRSVAGVWNSKLGTVTLQHAAPTGTTPVAVTGFHDESRKNRAEVRNGSFDPATGVLTFTYFQPWRNVTGTARFILSADNQKLTGTYTQPGATGPWNLERAAQPAVVAGGTASQAGGAQTAAALVGALFGLGTPATTATAPAGATTEKPAAAPPAPAAASAPATAASIPVAPASPVPLTARSVAGVWNSKLGTVTLQHAPPTGLAPVAVTGFHDESRKNRAELRDGSFDPITGTLVFTYFQPWRNVTGTARFALSADNLRLTGTYTQPGATGPWNLERAEQPAVVAGATGASASGVQTAAALVGALFGLGSTGTAAAPASAPATPSTPAPAPAPTAKPPEPAPTVAAVIPGPPPPAVGVVSDTQPPPDLPVVTGDAKAVVLPPEPAPLGLRAGLVGEWLLAGDLRDSSGRGFDGKPSGGIAWAPDRAGRPGQALQFNGRDAKLDCGPLPGANLTQQATLSVWLKLEGKPGLWHVAGKAGGGTDLDLIVDNGALRFFVGGGTNCTSSRKVSEGEWVHVAASFRAGGKLKVYLAGQLDGAVDVGERGENPNSFTLGESGAWPGRWFQGVLDDVRLYDRQLDDAEIAALAAEK